MPVFLTVTHDEEKDVLHTIQITIEDRMVWFYCFFSSSFFVVVVYILDSRKTISFTFKCFLKLCWCNCSIESLFALHICTEVTQSPSKFGTCSRCSSKRTLNACMRLCLCVSVYEFELTLKIHFVLCHLIKKKKKKQNECSMWCLKWSLSHNGRVVWKMISNQWR